MEGRRGWLVHKHIFISLIISYSIFFSIKPLCSSLSSALNCILSLFFLSSVQVSVFLSSSHLSVESAHLFLCVFGNMSWGGFLGPNCQVLIAFCCPGRHNAAASRGHLDRRSDRCSVRAPALYFRAPKRRIQQLPSGRKRVAASQPRWASSQPAVQIIAPDSFS